jgi:hypothetical protein
MVRTERNYNIEDVYFEESPQQKNPRTCAEGAPPPPILYVSKFPWKYFLFREWEKREEILKKESCLLKESTGSSTPGNTLRFMPLGDPPQPPLGAHTCIRISPTTFNNALPYLP